MSDEDDGSPREGGGARDPYARPSDLPPPEDDPEPGELGALAAGSRPSWPKALAEDARLDIGALARASAAAPSLPAPAPSVPPVAREPEPEWTPRRSAFPSWSGPLAVGFAVGLGAGAILFRTPAATSGVAAPASVVAGAPAAHAPPPEPAMPAADLPEDRRAAEALPPAETRPVTAPEVDVDRAGPPRERRAGAADEYGRDDRAGAPVEPATDIPSAPALTVTASPEREPAPVAPAVAPATPAGRNMDTLLDEALSEPARKAELRQQREAAETTAALPLTPSREDVEAAVAVLTPAIRGCAMGQSGLATADIVVRPDGTVAGVHVTGAPFAGAASGRCMEGVVRRARFPRFRKPSLRIQYPFSIQ